jgi:hypothetical protein
MSTADEPPRWRPTQMSARLGVPNTCGASRLQRARSTSPISIKAIASTRIHDCHPSGFAFNRRVMVQGYYGTGIHHIEQVTGV